MVLGRITRPSVRLALLGASAVAVADPGEAIIANHSNDIWTLQVKMDESHGEFPRTRGVGRPGQVPP